MHPVSNPQLLRPITFFIHPSSFTYLSSMKNSKQQTQLNCVLVHPEMIIGIYTFYHFRDAQLTRFYVSFKGVLND